MMNSRFILSFFCLAFHYIVTLRTMGSIGACCHLVERPGNPRKPWDRAELSPNGHTRKKLPAFESRWCNRSENVNRGDNDPVGVVRGAQNCVFGSGDTTRPQCALRSSGSRRESERALLPLCVPFTCCSDRAGNTRLARARARQIKLAISHQVCTCGCAN